MGKTLAIVGGGLGGLTAAIKLRQAGHRITLFEASDSVGGVWRDNRYPGAACDVPANLYQLSFAPNPDWSHVYARQPEILRYCRGLIAQFGLGDSLRLNEGVACAEWDEAAAQWIVTTTKGAEERFDGFVPATGQLSRPAMPALPGIADFAGPMFHSARWDVSVDLAGKHVGIVGSGCSAAQIIPEVAAVAGHLTVFQRTPNWVLPRGDKAVTQEEKALFMTRPEAAMKLGAMQRQLTFESADEFLWPALSWEAAGRAAWERIAHNHLTAQVADPALRAALTPDYPVGCKRVIFADDFYPALTRANVTLDTSPIRTVTRDGITTDQHQAPIDVLIAATGFETTNWNWSFDVIGVGGQSLADAWRGGAEAYLGILVHGFPNMFVIYGPNTNLGHSSITYMMEAQVDYTVRALAVIEEEGAASIDVAADAQARQNATLQAELAATVWADPACHSWYKTDDGRNPQNWSRDARGYTAATAEVVRGDVVLV